MFLKNQLLWFSLFFILKIKKQSFSYRSSRKGENKKPPREMYWHEGYLMRQEMDAALLLALRELWVAGIHGGR